MILYTIGHSTRTLEELIRLLQENRIETLVDIRSFPASRRLPQFNRENLEARLPESGIAYRWMGKELGGYRKRKDPNSPHMALGSAGFRNYADHMTGEQFRRGIEELENLARESRVAYMCAEKLWWRCHRPLVSDFLTACRGAEVVHIIDSGRTEPHRLHRAARLANGELIYDVGEKPALV